jgi:hypothetical protein
MNICLKESINKNSKEIELISTIRDVDNSMIDVALSVVRKFIIDRKLILFGGLAIDYALRLRGSRIYPDEERPDFDFLSPKSVDDAYDLADLLKTIGFKKVGAIRAIHVQTMRVKVDFIWVADIGYAPQDVFDKIPTIEYDQMRVVHPNYQRIDMHLAFCYPFNNPPREDVLNRWKKDLKRYNLLNKFYPIKDELGSIKDIKTEIKFIDKTFDLPIKIFNNENIAISGLLAYYLLRGSLSELYDSFKKELPELKFAKEFKCLFDLSSFDKISISLPDFVSELAFVSPCLDKIISNYDQKAIWYEPYMDLEPENILLINNKLRIYSSKNRLLSISTIKHQDNIIRIVSNQFLLAQFLFGINIKNGICKYMYLQLYLSVLEILQLAESLFLEELSRPNKGANKELLNLYSSSPFYPSIRTIGNNNYDISYIIKIAMIADKTSTIPSEKLGINYDMKNLLNGLPQNYYPETAKFRPDFNYEFNQLFNRSGNERISIKL